MKQSARAALKAATTKSRKPIKRLEDELQRQQVKYLTMLENQGRLRFFAVPNGGKRSKIEASIMKGLGVRAGVPDLLILWNRLSGGWELDEARTGLIENKSPKGVISDEQRKWMQDLGDMGIRTAVCRDFPAFLRTLYDWGIISAKEAGVDGGAP